MLIVYIVSKSCEISKTNYLWL